jgi:zinc/manganese transport system permease protein
MFLLVLALTVTGAAQVVGTLLVLSLAITPAAAAQRLSANPLAVAALSVVFAVAAADGGLLASFGASNVKASVFITSISFVIYLAARLAGPRLRDRRQRSREERRVQSQARAYARCAPEPAGTEMSRSDGLAGQLDKHVPSGLGWPGVLAGRSRDLSPAGRERLGLPP